MNKGFDVKFEEIQNKIQNLSEDNKAHQQYVNSKYDLI